MGKKGFESLVYSMFLLEHNLESVYAVFPEEFVDGYGGSAIALTTFLWQYETLGTQNHYQTKMNMPCLSRASPVTGSQPRGVKQAIP